MTKINQEQPNQETLWAGKSGDRWLANIDRFEAMLAPIGDALLELAATREGEQIVDIGCGAGVTSIAIAQQLKGSGSVMGLDISPVLITEATKRAEKLGLENLRFTLGDAAIASFSQAQADCVISRFGIMFFSNPRAAFTHIHGFLKPEGRLAIACWADLAQNPWMSEAQQIISSHIPMPTLSPRAPGAFAFSEPDYVREILEAAGFRNINISPWQHNLTVGGLGSTPESAAQFMLTAVGITQLSEDVSDLVKATIHSQLCDRLKTFHTKDGVQMPALAWFVSAKA